MQLDARSKLSTDRGYRADGDLVPDFWQRPSRERLEDRLDDSRLLALVSDRVVDRALDRAARLPAGQLAEPHRVRLAATQLLESLPRRASSYGTKRTSELDALRATTCRARSMIRITVAADVEGPADCRVGVHDLYQGANLVGYVAEAARLLPVPVHGQSLAGERLRDEAWENHSVCARLSRTNGVLKIRTVAISALRSRW